MATIEIEDDIHSYLLQHIEEIGESASSILRRRLIAFPKTTATEAGGQSELAEFLASSGFRRLRNVKDRFLAILGEVYRRDPDAFAAVEDIAGRKRQYFSTDRSQIMSSGKSVAPREIPGSPYWVMTNASTSYKKTLLRKVMHVLDYSDLAIREATRAIG